MRLPPNCQVKKKVFERFLLFFESHASLAGITIALLLETLPGIRFSYLHGLYDMTDMAHMSVMS